MTEPRNTGLRKVAALTIHLGPEQSAVLGTAACCAPSRRMRPLFEEKASGGCNSTRRSQSSDPR